MSTISRPRPSILESIREYSGEADDIRGLPDVYDP